MKSKQEFPKNSGISIRTIPNITKGAAYGESYLVTLPGKVTGKGRQRKQFTTLDSAKQFAAESFNGVREVGGRFIELEREDRDASLRLLDAIKERGDKAQDIVDDVISALKGLGKSELRLTQCVTFSLPRLSPSKLVTVAEAAQSLREVKQGEISQQYQRTLGVQLDRITEALGSLPVSHLDAVKINEFISTLRLRDTTDDKGKVITGKPASPKFRKHVLGAMRQLIRHAVSRGCSRNWTRQTG